MLPLAYLMRLYAPGDSPYTHRAAAMRQARLVVPVHWNAAGGVLFVPSPYSSGSCFTRLSFLLSHDSLRLMR